MKRLLLSTLLLLSVTSLSQEDTANVEYFDEILGTTRGLQGLKFGLSGGRHLFGELSWYYEEMEESFGLPIAHVPSLHVGTEYGYINQPILAPKVGTRLHVLFLEAGLSFLWYTDLNGGYAPTIRPEIGFGLFSEFELLYGYNWDLVNQNMPMINAHMITLRFNLILREKYLYLNDTPVERDWVWKLSDGF